jgi:8-oxo-dGTP pyrophosphatase MutT (NUDIX family)
MSDSVGAAGPLRTVLEQRIRERRQTFEEFAEFAETFAREHDEPGTLSVRHLQRLVTGRQSGESLRPATARLLERIFGMSIVELLAAPQKSGNEMTVDPQYQLSYALRVAVAVVVKDFEVLVVCRRGDEGNGIAWQFPAGIVKPGMSSETVAVRETFAETGVHCSVVRKLGSRVHPITNVVCDYMLCDYLTGNAENIDVIENVGVAWVGRDQLARFIPVEQIYPPVLDALQVTSPLVSNAG